MATRLFLSFVTIVLVLAMSACQSSAFPQVKIVVSTVEINEEDSAVVKTGEDIPPIETMVIEAEEPVETEDVSISTEVSQMAYPPDMKVLFEEMTFVQVLSEEYARIEAVCAGVGLNNIKPLPDGPRILIPNAGDLSVDGSNVAIKLEPDGEISFIPRVQGQRIRVPIDVADKLAGQEVDRLSLAEAMQLIAADKLYWTAKGHGPYGTGHGLPGHIAECDSRYGKVETSADLSAPVTITEDTSRGPEIEASKTLPYTPDMRVLFEEMTFVRLLSEEYARIESVCAGVGLNTIKPLPDEPIILIPNAGDLSVDGSNVAIKLEPDGEISFIPRVQGQRIRVPVNVGAKVAGEEVLSLRLDEAMRLMAADKLYWTARGQGPYSNGHGLPGHIAECDPRYRGS
jgi:hypothetical protein